MRKTLMTGLLLLAFSCPAFAGEMLTPPAPQPPSSPATATQEPIDDEMLTPPGVAESLTQAALELLAVLPSLL